MINKIMICATQRSGSTMICEDLRATGVLGNPREYFNKWIKSKDLDWREEAASLLADGTGPNGIFSVKIMANQVKPVNERLATILPPSAARPPLAEFFEGALWVWVRRRDTLAQAISRHIAQESGIYHLGPTEIAAAVDRREISDAAAASVSMDFKAIMMGWHWLKRYDLLWEAFFQLAGIEPLTVWYEDAVHTNVAKKIAEIIGVRLPEAVPPRALERLAGPRSEELRNEFLRQLLEKG